jgi:hypothetical protein
VRLVSQGTTSPLALSPGEVPVKSCGFILYLFVQAKPPSTDWTRVFTKMHRFISGTEHVYVRPYIPFRFARRYSGSYKHVGS